MMILIAEELYLFVNRVRSSHTPKIKKRPL